MSYKSRKEKHFCIEKITQQRFNIARIKTKQNKCLNKLLKNVKMLSTP